MERTPRELVTIANWLQPDLVRWSFQNLPAVMPTAGISRGNGPIAPLAGDPVDLARLEVGLHDGTTTSVRALVTATDTDG